MRGCSLGCEIYEVVSCWTKQGSDKWLGIKSDGLCLGLCSELAARADGAFETTVGQSHRG